MKLRHGLLLLAILVVSVSVVRADTIPGDPGSIIVGGGGGTLDVTGNFFSFTTADTESCSLFLQFNSVLSGFTECFSFLNLNNYSWTNMLIVFEIPVGDTIGTVTCDTSTAFPTCIATQNSIFFDDLSVGIGPLSHGVIGLTGWPDGTKFFVEANVPEPGTMALFLTGLGALVARRRLRKPSAA